MPVGNYFKGGLVPTNFLIQDEYDRAAPNGTGAAKLVGTMLPVSCQGNWPSHVISQMLSI